jgi:hypothetical protein
VEFGVDFRYLNKARAVSFAIHPVDPSLTIRSVRLSLSAKSASHLAMFFSHNKSASSTFSQPVSVYAKEDYSQKFTRQQ